MPRVGIMMSCGVLPWLLGCAVPKRAEFDSVFVSGLGDPAGIAVSPSGLVFVADAARGEVAVFDASGRRLRTIGKGLLQSPLGVALDTDGSLLVSDSLEDRVYRFASDDSVISSFGHTGTETEAGSFSGAGPLAVSKTGDIYVTDIDHDRVQVFDRQGAFRFTFGKKGKFGNSAPGELYFPGGLALDRTGRVLVADTHNFRLQVFSGQGRFEASWGRQGNGFGEFDHAFGIAVDDAEGLVYVADDRIKLARGGLRVDVFSLAGKPLGWLQPGAGEPPLHHPFGVAVATGGRILVTERGTGRVRVLRLDDMHKASAAAASRPSSRPTGAPKPTSRPRGSGQ